MQPAPTSRVELPERVTRDGLGEDGAVGEQPMCDVTAGDVADEMQQTAAVASAGAGCVVSAVEMGI